MATPLSTSWAAGQTVSSAYLNALDALVNQISGLTVASAQIVTASTYTGSTSYVVYFVDCSSNACVFTLPPIVSGTRTLIRVKRFDTTYNPSGGVTFAASFGNTLLDTIASLGQGQSVDWESNGVSAWGVF
jgi:hypothetical protein